MRFHFVPAEIIVCDIKEGYDFLQYACVPSNLKLQKAKIYFQANLDFSTVLQSICNLPLHILTTEFDTMLKIKKRKYVTSRLGPEIIPTQLQIHIKLISCHHHYFHLIAQVHLDVQQLPGSAPRYF